MTGREKIPCCDRKELIRRSLGIFRRKMRDDFLWHVFFLKTKNTSIKELT